MFTRNFLLDVRRRARRRGVWFKSLDNIERGILNLVTRVVDKVESTLLGVVLVRILKKLRDAMKSEFVRRMEGFGLRRAREVARQALEWGYGAARGWASDLGFARYLTMIDMNRPSGFGV